jgi:ABC-type bacteriocin/lantibiotic exporter with double-glycine peptidase domain
LDQEIPEKVDSGLVCLVMLSRLHDMPADPGRLKYYYGQSEKHFTESEIFRGTKLIGLKTRASFSSQNNHVKTQVKTITQYLNSFCYTYVSFLKKSFSNKKTSCLVKNCFLQIKIDTFLFQGFTRSTLY